MRWRSTNQPQQMGMLGNSIYDEDEKNSINLCDKSRNISDDVNIFAKLLSVTRKIHYEQWVKRFNLKWHTSSIRLRTYNPVQQNRWVLLPGWRSYRNLFRYLASVSFAINTLFILLYTILICDHIKLKHRFSSDIEVRQRWFWSVLGWVTTGEYPVLSALLKLSDVAHCSLFLSFFQCVRDWLAKLFNPAFCACPFFFQGHSQTICTKLEGYVLFILNTFIINVTRFPGVPGTGTMFVPYNELIMTRLFEHS